MTFEKTVMMRCAPLLVACLLAGCQTAAQPSTTKDFERLEAVQLSKETVEIIHSGVQGVLKDPDSAQFGSIAAGRDGNGTVRVCGTVNAKNSFGGYTGMQPFYGLLMADISFSPINVGGDDIEQSVIRQICAQHGLLI